MPSLIAYDELHLPSGVWVHGVRPTADELIRRGIYPSELRAAVAAMDARPATATPDGDMSDEDLATMIEHTHTVIAGYIREVSLDEGATWQRAAFTPSQVHDFNSADLDALEDVVLRRRTVDQVNRGLSVAEAAREEAGGNVEAWAAFRDDGRRAGDGDDGADVEHAAVGAARSDGPGRRADARRGARHAPADEE